MVSATIAPAAMAPQLTRLLTPMMSTALGLEASAIELPPLIRSISWKFTRLEADPVANRLRMRGRRPRERFYLVGRPNTMATVIGLPRPDSPVGPAPLRAVSGMQSPFRLR